MDKNKMSIEGVIKHSEIKDELIRELISLNLWQARRIGKHYKEFVYDELEKITDEEYERL